MDAESTNRAGMSLAFQARPFAFVAQTNRWLLWCVEHIEGKTPHGKEVVLGRVRKASAATSVAALMLVMMAAPAFAFHHGGLPATQCHAEAAGSPSNDNGQAKENLGAHNPRGLPLPPVGTPGQG